VIPEQGRHFFLEIHERLGSLTTGALLGELLLELGDPLVATVDRFRLATALLRLEARKLATLSGLPPTREHRRVEPLASEQRPNLPGLAARVDLFEHRPFVLGRESPSLGFRRHLNFGQALA